jgi:hypothetical protein
VILISSPTDCSYSLFSFGIPAGKIRSGEWDGFIAGNLQPVQGKRILGVLAKADFSLLHPLRRSELTDRFCIRVCEFRSVAPSQYRANSKVSGIWLTLRILISVWFTLSILDSSLLL